MVMSTSRMDFFSEFSEPCPRCSGSGNVNADITSLSSICRRCIGIGRAAKSPEFFHQVKTFLTALKEYQQENDAFCGPLPPGRQRTLIHVMLDCYQWTISRRLWTTPNTRIGNSFAWLIMASFNKSRKSLNQKIQALVDKTKTVVHRMTRKRVFVTARQLTINDCPEHDVMNAWSHAITLNPNSAIVRFHFGWYHLAHRRDPCAAYEHFARIRENQRSAITWSALAYCKLCDNPKDDVLPELEAASAAGAPEALTDYPCAQRWFNDHLIPARWWHNELRKEQKRTSQ